MNELEKEEFLENLEYHIDSIEELLDNQDDEDEAIEEIRDLLEQIRRVKV